MGWAAGAVADVTEGAPGRQAQGLCLGAGARPARGRELSQQLCGGMKAKATSGGRASPPQSTCSLSCWPLEELGGSLSYGRSTAWSCFYTPPKGGRVS